MLGFLFGKSEKKKIQDRKKAFRRLAFLAQKHLKGRVIERGNYFGSATIEYLSNAKAVVLRHPCFLFTSTRINLNWWLDPQGQKKWAHRIQFNNGDQVDLPAVKQGPWTNELMSVVASFTAVLEQDEQAVLAEKKAKETEAKRLEEERKKEAERIVAEARAREEAEKNKPSWIEQKVLRAITVWKKKMSWRG